MPLGTAIFLSALLLSIVILFALTKDRWNWHRLTKWAALVSITVILLMAGGAYLYSYWEDRPTPQNEFLGLQLLATTTDVKLSKGEPETISPKQSWIYNVSKPPSKEAFLFVGFEKERVNRVMYIAPEAAPIENPYLLGFTYGNSNKRIQEKLGTPSYVSISSDELNRMISYDKLNVFFVFKEGKLIGYGIYDPKEGPMKYPNEKPSSGQE